MGEVRQDFWEKVNSFLSKPSIFFSGVKEKSLWRPIGIYFLAVIVSLVLGYLVNLTASLIAPNMFGFNLPVLYFIFGVIISILAFVFIFIFGLVVHFIVKVIFRGSGRYRDTMKVLLYSYVPVVLVGFSTFDILFVIYSLVLATIGLSVSHEVKKSRAFISVFIVLLVVISLVVFWILGLSFGLSSLKNLLPI